MKMSKKNKVLYSGMVLLDYIDDEIRGMEFLARKASRVAQISWPSVSRRTRLFEHHVLVTWYVR